MKPILFIDYVSERASVVRILADKGADLESKDKLGKTSLHIAAEISSLEMVQILVEKGANVNAGTKLGYSPLHLAVSNGEFEFLSVYALEKLFIMIYKISK